MPTLDEVVLKNAIATGDPQAIAQAKAKLQENQVAADVQAGTPWWKAQGNQTTWYSGGDNLSGKQAFANSASMPADQRVGYDGVRPLNQAAIADYQAINNPQPKPGPTLHFNENDLSPEDFQKREQQIQADSIKNQQSAFEHSRQNEALAKNQAAYDATPEGMRRQAKMNMFQLGMSGPQAFGVANAQGNQDRVADVFNPQGGVARINQAGAIGVADIGLKGIVAQKEMEVQAAKDRLAFAAQQNNAVMAQQAANNLDMKQKELEIVKSKGEQNANAARDAELAKRGMISNGGGIGGQQMLPSPLQAPGLWWKQNQPAQQGSGALPGYTNIGAVPLDPMQQQQHDLNAISIEKAKRESDIAAQKLANPNFDKERQRIASANDPTIPFSEDNKEAISQAVSDHARKGTPLPTQIQDGLKKIWTDDEYDNDYSSWNPLNWVGKGQSILRNPDTPSGQSYFKSNEEIFADYLQKHYNVAPSDALKWFRETFPTEVPGGAGFERANIFGV